MKQNPDGTLKKKKRKENDKISMVEFKASINILYFSVQYLFMYIYYIHMCDYLIFKRMQSYVCKNNRKV